MFEVALVLLKTSSEEVCGWLFYVSVLWFPLAVHELTVHPHFPVVRHTFAIFCNSLSSLTVYLSSPHNLLSHSLSSLPVGFLTIQHLLAGTMKLKSLILHSIWYDINNTLFISNHHAPDWFCTFVFAWRVENWKFPTFLSLCFQSAVLPFSVAALVACALCLQTFVTVPHALCAATGHNENNISAVIYKTHCQCTY